MATVAFSVMYDHVLPSVPGVETPMVDFQLRRCLRDFYKRSCTWRQLFQFNTTAEASAYNMVPTYGTVAAILKVKIEHVPIDPIVEDARHCAGLVEDAKPTNWHSAHPNIVTLYPTPDAAYATEVETALTLALDGDDLFEEDTYINYAEIVANGTIAFLQGMPAKPWTQFDSAKYLKRQYDNAVLALRASLRDGGQPNNSTLRGPRFGR